VHPIDLNCDMGESPDAVSDGRQEQLMRHVTSVSIACGGHAGDEWTIRETVAQARRHGCAIGAHPSYPDRANFGRLRLDMPLEDLEHSLFRQVRAVGEIAEIAHVKPHGALYNEAARDAGLAQTIARAVARWSRDVVLVGLAGSTMLDVFAAAGFRVAAEGFADRSYESDGSLVARSRPGALITDPEEAARQALGLARGGKVETICIHSDTPGAAAIAKRVAHELRKAGFLHGSGGALREQ
jgi:UPF0271 protein